MNLDQIAVQLYTLRAHTATDMLGTLRQVAAIGYRAVEFAGYGDQTASTIRPTLDELGLKHLPRRCPSTSSKAILRRW